ncbi:MAG TPA: hypothetical protein VHC90_01740 [Bryobacteraceae bacterium]|nr:hypothetical protein [Bryobacteraceae bacterium]
MKRVSVRELGYCFKDVEAKLAAGEEIEVVKRDQAIARMVPDAPAGPPKVDFRARMKEVWGNGTFDFSFADLISEGRGEH